MYREHKPVFVRFPLTISIYSEEGNVPELVLVDLDAPVFALCRLTARAGRSGIFYFTLVAKTRNPIHLKQGNRHNTRPAV